jgi:hypothetical protein
MRKIGRILVFAVCFLLSTESRSQILHNGSNIFVEASAEIHIDGGIDNKAFIENNGTIEVTADWSSKNIYQGTGSIHFTGNEQHFANNNQGVLRIVVENQRLIITDSIIVSRELILSHGIVQFQGRGSLTIEQSANINGGSQSSFIDGRVYAEGTGYRRIPLGADGQYLPITLNDVKGVNPVLEVSVGETLREEPIPGIKSISTYFWKRGLVSGGFEQSSITIPVVGIEDSENLIMFSSADGENFRIVPAVQRRTEDGFTMVTSAEELSGIFFGLGVAEILPDKKFYLSTTLSPHAASPENRYSRIFGDHLLESDFNFVVFDRWGSKVFSTRSLSFMTEPGWDGRTDSGNVLASGSYAYTLTARDKTGRPIQQKGTLTIIN